MADLNNGLKKPTESEPSMEKRMLLAFLVMGAILFATPYFYRAFVPQQAPKPAVVTQVEKARPEQGPPPAPAAAAQRPPAAPAPAPVSAQQEELRTIDTNLYRIVFSNRGAVVRSWLLKNYKDSSGKPLDLVSSAGAAKTGYPFSLSFKNGKPPVDLNSVLWAVRPGPDGLSLAFEYSDGTTAARKTFQFEKNRYISAFTSEVTENGNGVPHLVAWRGGFGDPAVKNAAGAQHALYYSIPDRKLVIEAAKVAKDGPVNHTGQYSFAGMQDTYFAAVFMPGNGDDMQVRVVSDTVPTAAGQADEPHVGVAVGGDAREHFEVFVGPKDVDLLQRVDPRLAQLVDFGTWFGWLARPLFTMIDWLNDSFIHNYGWAIVIITVFINVALMPLRFSSIRSMKKMSALQPQIQAINAKYKGVGIRDPRNQEKNAEVMELYKKHGVNPVGGCLPMLLQIPFFIAFYTVLTVAIEMRGANWLWIKDLSHYDPFYILPIAMVVAQFVQQKMTPNPSADPSQQRMMMLMPLVFGFMFMTAASGLVLYWFTSNLVGIVMQFFINKTMGVPAMPQQPAPAAAVAPVKRKTGGKR